MTTTRRRLDSVFVLALLAVFAASVLACLLLGVRAYEAVSQTGDAGYDARTCLSYAAAKIRHFSAAGAVRIGELDGCSALVLTETAEDGTVYETKIYCADGAVRELYCEAGLGLGADAGTVLLPAQSLTFSEPEPGLVSICCVGGDGVSASMFVRLDCEASS